jgi:small subunit ribosomal protein S20
MNKRERNRKLTKQNLRNRLVNRKYLLTIKKLSKLFRTTVSEYATILEDNLKTETKDKLVLVTRSLVSIIDKSVKKKILHKNNAARKKSKLTKKFKSVFY